MIDSKKRYNELTNFNSKSLNKVVRVALPKLVERDYARGYIVRYFAQKVNDKSAPISEITSIEYNKLINSPMYIVTNLRWRITGSYEPVYKEGNIMLDKGVRLSNKTSIQLASDEMTNLKLYLPNLVQFNKKNPKL